MSKLVYYTLILGISRYKESYQTLNSSSKIIDNKLAMPQVNENDAGQKERPRAFLVNAISLEDKFPDPNATGPKEQPKEQPKKEQTNQTITPKK